MNAGVALWIVAGCVLLETVGRLRRWDRNDRLVANLFRVRADWRAGQLDGEEALHAAMNHLKLGEEDGL